ncbi:hypothetical protein [Chlorogloea sp. CCALA 695]|uniref:hypothetical protein n=1 Tax=Chlorogloea sp. CCALA 695 TaxID=2107693 RepID=UPI000D05CBB2|nr:hypothetical protein [Chlorogloea sp. CCALA 695]PSB34763.1 hypothetical protein C7B70_02680 [Chlorogloea sp. CCALA 695]
MTQNIDKEIKSQLKRWHYSAISLHSTYIALGVISVVSSVLVATFTEELEPFWIKVLAATSATSVALIKTTDVGRKGNGFRQAHRHLKAAELRRFDTGEKSNQDVIKAFAEAEFMIGDVVIAIRDSPE